MNLDQTSRSAASRLRSGQLDNEAQVKQAVILPILRALGWDDSDPETFKPEYSAGSGRVDYALPCHGRPQVFIEAKRRGALDVRAEEQLFGYASNRGVPLLVLTDGYHRDFYLSMAGGPPEERRFDRLKLRDENQCPDYAEVLEAHLRKRYVASGAAQCGRTPGEQP